MAPTLKWAETFLAISVRDSDEGPGPACGRCEKYPYGATGPLTGPFGCVVGSAFPIEVAEAEHAGCPQPVGLVVCPVLGSTVVS